MSALQLTTGPTLEPISLAEARSHCRVDHESDDAVLAALIMAARQHVEVYTGRCLLTQTWKQYEDGFGAGIRLHKSPVASITSIEYVDSAGATQTLSGSVYQSVLTTEPPYIVPAYGQSWPATRDQPQAVTVTFVAGYATVGAIPEPIRHAMRLLIGHFYENREAVNVGNIVTDLPFGVEALLFPFKAW